MKLGKHQRAILAAMRAGAELYNEMPWCLRYPDGRRQTQDRRRCLALWTRGFIMQASGTRCELTEKGRAAG